MGSLQQILKDARSSYANKQSAKGKKKPNMKRIIKNLKYGSGYTHKGIKGKNKNRNTYSSSMNYQYDWKQRNLIAIISGEVMKEKVLCAVDMLEKDRVVVVDHKGADIQGTDHVADIVEIIKAIRADIIRM